MYIALKEYCESGVCAFAVPMESQKFRNQTGEPLIKEIKRTGGRTAKRWDFRGDREKQRKTFCKNQQREHRIRR